MLLLSEQPAHDIKREFETQGRIGEPSLAHLAGSHLTSLYLSNNLCVASQAIPSSSHTDQESMHRRDFLKQTSALVLAATQSPGKTSATEVSIQADRFFINGRPTYQGRSFRGMKIEGLLMNSRMVQGVFDDLNSQTRDRWKYPDTGKWDADRNTREFVAAMPEWRQHGLLSFTICLQGGSPEGYSNVQPWHNSAFTPEGELRPEYLRRLARILDRADELGMASIVGFFYFGQAHRLNSEQAVIRAVENATDWLLEKGYSNVLIEIGNEINHPGYPPVLGRARVHKVIEMVQRRSAGKVRSPAGRLL